MCSKHNLKTFISLLFLFLVSVFGENISKSIHFQGSSQIYFLLPCIKVLDIWRKLGVRLLKIDDFFKRFNGQIHVLIVLIFHAYLCYRVRCSIYKLLHYNYPIELFSQLGLSGRAELYNM